MPRKHKDTKRVESEDEENYYSKAKPVQQEDEAEYLQEDEYNVESIMDMKVELGKKYYFIKWEGFPHSQNTWEPIEHLAKVAYMVEQFEEDYAKGKSLAMMEQENPGYFPLEDEEEFPLRKEKETRDPKKKNDVNEGNEMLFKKRKLNNISDDGEILFEKKPIGEENNFDLGDDDGIQEITTVKEDLTKTKPRKKNVSKPFTKAPPLDEDLENENTWKSKSSPKTETSSAFFATQINDNEIVNGKTARSLRGVVAGSRKGQSKPGTGRAAASKKKDKTGSFRNKDKPQSILSIKHGRQGGFDFFVEWQRRYDGSQPDNSMVSNEEMKKNDPYFLIDFYEGKIICISKNKKKGLEKEPEKMNVEASIEGTTVEPQLTKAKENLINLDDDDDEITVSPPRSKLKQKETEIEQPRSDSAEKKLIEVVGEHANELNFISPVKETPAKGILTNKTITSPQEIISSPGEEIVVNVRDRGLESSPDSEKKKSAAENADNMIGDLDEGGFDLMEQHHPLDWQQQQQNNTLESSVQVQAESVIQVETQEKASLYSEIHANQAQHFMPSLDSEQLQAQRLLVIQSLESEQVGESREGDNQEQPEEGEKENTGILTETIDEGGDKEVNEEEDVGNNKENQSSLVSVI